MNESNRPPAYTPPSSEGEAMARAERARWLIVAEAQTVRESWERTKKSIDGMVETYEKDPEDAMNAVMLITLTVLSAGTFGEQLHGAAQKLGTLVKDVVPNAR